MPKAKIDTFLQQKDAHTKYRQIQRKFSRLKVITYEINEVWSIDVAYVDKLVKYNNGKFTDCSGCGIKIFTCCINVIKKCS